MPASEAAYAEARAARQALHDFLAAQIDDRGAQHWAALVARDIARRDVEPRKPSWFGGMGALDDLCFDGPGAAERNRAFREVLGRFSRAMHDLILEDRGAR